MLIHEKIKEDIKTAMKQRLPIVSELRYIMGEFTRIKGTKDGKALVGNILTDEQAIRILNKLEAQEHQTAKYQEGGSLLDIIKGYLPKQISDDEITGALMAIDFSQLKNKMQAVGMVKKAYGPEVDAKRVKKIIEARF